MLRKLFVIIYMSAATPESWDIDIKVPLLKPGRSGKALSDLRPVTIVNSITKMYEGWIWHLLNKEISSHEAQAGYKKGYSCVQRIFLLRSVFDYCQYTGIKSLYCAFLDFSSFFDTIRTDLLCVYLLKRGVTSHLVRAIYGMLQNVSASVRMKQTVTAPFKVSVGVRQGSVLSPQLATLFLDQISEELDKMSCFDLHGRRINHIFYADDLLIFDSNPHSLQIKLDRVASLCNQLGLRINSEKTKTMNLSYSKTVPKRTFSIDGQLLESCKEFKYLGCIISNRFSFDKHFRVRCGQSHGAFFKLLSFQQRFPTLKYYRFIELYRRMVLPILTYGSELYGWKNYAKVDEVVAHHIGIYLRLPNKVHSNVLFWATGTISPKCVMWLRGYDFWISLLKLSEDRYEKRAVIASTFLQLRSIKSWISEMLEIFSLIAFEGDFSHWSARDAIVNRNSFVLCVRNFFVESMYLHIASSKYSFLLNCFPSFDFREYVNFSTPQGRNTIAKLLFSMHHMEIETGRWNNVDRRIRFCTYCMKNRSVYEIGDELHYISFCPQFEHIRRRCSEKLAIANVSFLDVISGHFYPDTSIYYKYAVVSTFVSFVLNTLKLAYRSS